jgi:hypothetical protein
MSTRASAALQPDNSVVANFRAWVQFIDDTLIVTGGWVNTADTGQMVIATAAAPVGANNKVGYRIYRMADALQATAPVFMRIDFGSNWNSQPCPGIWVTIGTGSNGAGVITGQVFTPITSATLGAQSTSTGATSNSYGSADASRFTIALFIGSTPGFNLIFGLERTKDSSGNDTAEGLLYAQGGGSEFGGNTNYFSRAAFLILAGGTQPNQETGLSYVTSFNNPTQTFGGDIGVGPIIFFKGVAQQPGKNWMIANSSDLAAESAFSMVIYGVTTTYKQLQAITVRMSLAGSVQGDTAARLTMRYD